MKTMAKILIVDEDDQNRNRLKDALELLDYKIHEVGGGQECLDQIRDINPIVVVMKVNMPKMDGNEVLIHLKSDPLLKYIPVLAISYDSDRDVLVGILNHGAEDVLVGPVEPTILMAKVRILVEKQILYTKAKNQYLKNQELLRFLLHDFGNALTVISANVKCFQKKEGHNEFVEDIQKATVLMTQMLKETREIQFLADEKNPFEFSQVDLHHLFDEIQFLFAQKLQDRKMKLVIQDHVGDQSIVWAERGILKNQILSALIDNAIKFSYIGSTIKVEIFHVNRCMQNDTDLTANDNILSGEKQLYLRIIDQGIGMPSEILKNLFILGQKTTRTGTDGQRGTGFGMILVKKYLDLMQGEIKIESYDIENHPKNYGTIVHLYLRSI